MDTSHLAAAPGGPSGAPTSCTAKEDPGGAWTRAFVDLLVLSFADAVARVRCVVAPTASLLSWVLPRNVVVFSMVASHVYEP